MYTALTITILAALLFVCALVIGACVMEWIARMYFEAVIMTIGAVLCVSLMFFALLIFFLKT